MKIALCYSMQFADQAKAVQEWFAERGHVAMPSSHNEHYVGLNDDQKEALKLDRKYNHDAIRKHYEVIAKSDVILVLNYEKYGIPGYIGGNVFLEMGFAYILHKPIWLLNDIPAMPFYETELRALQPIVLGGNLEKILT